MEKVRMRLIRKMRGKRTELHMERGVNCVSPVISKDNQRVHAYYY